MWRRSDVTCHKALTVVVSPGVGGPCEPAPHNGVLMLLLEVRYPLNDVTASIGVFHIHHLIFSVRLELFGHRLGQDVFIRFLLTLSVAVVVRLVMVRYSECSGVW